MRLIVNSTSCVPPFAQLAGVAALEGPQDAVTAMVAEFRRRRDFLVPALNAIPGVRCIEPGGAFYAFPNVSALPIDGGRAGRPAPRRGGRRAARRHAVRQRRSRPPADLVRVVAREPRAGGRAHPPGSSPRCRTAAVRRPLASVEAWPDSSTSTPTSSRPATMAPSRSRRGSRSAASPSRPAPRSCSRRRTRTPPGITTRAPRRATRSTRPRSPRCGRRSLRWGLDLRRGWEVFPSEVAASDPAELVLEGTRAVLIEFPGFVARSSTTRSRPSPRPPPLVEAAGLVPVLAHPERCRRRRGRPRARSSARRARLAALPQRPVARSAATARPPSARAGRCSMPGSSRSRPPTRTRRAAARPRATRTRWCANG